MNQKTTKQLTHWLSVIIIGVALGLGLQFVRAWTEPTAAPPGGNVGAPINTSANPQTKAGSFTSNGNITANQFCLGGVCISAWPSGVTPATPCTCRITEWGGYYWLDNALGYPLGQTPWPAGSYSCMLVAPSSNGLFQCSGGIWVPI